jgi:hypothetical protein
MLAKQSLFFSALLSAALAAPTSGSQGNSSAAVNGTSATKPKVILDNDWSPAGFLHTHKLCELVGTSWESLPILPTHGPAKPLITLLLLSREAT